DVIKQIQQAIVYIEDRLLEPFNLQELSDYVGLSPYHLDQSFKMIVGQSPEEYARARKMTIAANDVVNGASRLMDVAKKYRYANSNDFANDFSDFHGISPIQATTKKDELKIQKRLYIKLSTTENAPYTYRLQETDDISLVGYSRFIPTKQLSNPFNIPDFLEDLLVEHLESRFLPGRHYALFNLQGEIDYATNEAWYYIESSLQLTLPYERNSLYVEIYPLDISFNDPFTKIQLWLPIKQEIYDLDEDYQN
ncbi:MAG: effector binding domain-containing protein, partial [Staphylococcus epidermidis]|nr:effector binding domain-containing protein [Staphylococcus epidermidis]